MENQPMGQTTEQTVERPMEQPVWQPPEKQGSSVTIWYIVLAAVVVIGLGLYFVIQPPADEAATDAQALTEQTQLPVPTKGNTTEDIFADLNQIQDSSATLDADASASANEVQGL